jgi:Tfp pilus assembly pilus retraction ATPase PilT
LITYEDPVEVEYYPNPETASRLGLDYTPRQKGRDAGSLTEVLVDALRQTPTAFYVGEVRRPGDWRAIVDFAGSGHLIFTTCHAGSLTETLDLLESAIGASTAAERSALASRVLAAIHLRPALLAKTIEEESKPMKAVLAAIWRRNSLAVNEFTSDGLSAVLPLCANDTNMASKYSFGYSHFADQIKKDVAGLPVEQKDVRTPYCVDLLRQALSFDLGGL